jgi:hypothetical protein
MIPLWLVHNSDTYIKIVRSDDNDVGFSKDGMRNKFKVPLGSMHEISLL